MEDGPALEQAGQGGEQGEEGCFHPQNATARGRKKSIESVSMRFLVRATDILVQFLFQACPADRGLELYEDEEEGGG